MKFGGLILFNLYNCKFPVNFIPPSISIVNKSTNGAVAHTWNEISKIIWWAQGDMREHEPQIPEHPKGSTIEALSWQTLNIVKYNLQEKKQFEWFS